MIHLEGYQRNELYRNLQEVLRFKQYQFLIFLFHLKERNLKLIFYKMCNNQL
jgi:hypothetical protein